jgi:hypothetical protein
LVGDEHESGGNWTYLYKGAVSASQRVSVSSFVAPLTALPAIVGGNPGRNFIETLQISRNLLFYSSFFKAYSPLPALQCHSAVS